MPRWKKRPTKQELIAVMDREHTVVAAAAHFDCSRVSLYDWISYYGLRKRYVREVSYHPSQGQDRQEPDASGAAPTPDGVLGSVVS